MFQQKNKTKQKPQHKETKKTKFSDNYIDL